jgi:hypothetical protein
MEANGCSAYDSLYDLEKLVYKVKSKKAVQSTIKDLFKAA